MVPGHGYLREQQGSSPLRVHRRLQGLLLFFHFFTWHPPWPKPSAWKCFRRSRVSLAFGAVAGQPLTACTTDLRCHPCVSFYQDLQHRIAEHVRAIRLRRQWGRPSDFAGCVDFLQPSVWIAWPGHAFATQLSSSAGVGAFNAVATQLLRAESVVSRFWFVFKLCSLLWFEFPLVDGR